MFFGVVRGRDGGCGGEAGGVVVDDLLDEAEEAGVALECVTEKVEDSPLGKLVMSLRAFAAENARPVL